MALLTLPDSFRSRISLRSAANPPGGDLALPAFDPVTASCDELCTQCMPVRPDRGLTPRLYAMWEAMVACPAMPEQPELLLDDSVVHAFDEADSARSPASGRVRGRWGSSRNWSGAVITARDGKLFTSVAASWFVPRASGVAGDTAESLPGGNRQCSVWIGLDGHRRYSMSLPQMGTRSLVAPDGTEQYHLWIQWWVRDELFGEVKVRNFPVDHDDEIRAKLDVLSPTMVQFCATNRTKELRMAAIWDAGATAGTITGVEVDPLDQAALRRSQAPVEGRHAVFCVERPSVMPSAQVMTEIHDLELAGKFAEAKEKKKAAIAGIKPYSLPRFADGIFRETLAEMRHPASLANSAEERDLIAARYIRMIETAPGRAAPPDVRRLIAPIAPARGGNRVEVRPVPAPT